MIVGSDFFDSAVFVKRLEVDFGGKTCLAAKPVRGGDSWFCAHGGRIDVALEGFGTAGNDEGDGFDVGVVDGLEGAHNFVFVHLVGLFVSVLLR